MSHTCTRSEIQRSGAISSRLVYSYDLHGTSDLRLERLRPDEQIRSAHARLRLERTWVRTNRIRGESEAFMILFSRINRNR